MLSGFRFVAASVGLAALLVGCGGLKQLEIRSVVKSSAYPGKGLKAADYYKPGKDHFAKGQFGLAVNAFHLALLFDEKSVDTLNGLAAAYDRLGRFDLSRRYYARAFKLNPKSAVTLNNIGYSHFLQGHYVKAVEYMAKAKAIDPNSKAILGNLAIAERASKAPPAAARRGGVKAAGAATGRPRLGLLDPIAKLALVSGAWVERTTASIQTLVTRSNHRFLALVRKHRVDPRLVSFLGVWEPRRLARSPVFRSPRQLARPQRPQRQPSVEEILARRRFVGLGGRVLEADMRWLVLHLKVGYMPVAEGNATSSYRDEFGVKKIPICGRLDACRVALEPFG